MIAFLHMLRTITNLGNMIAKRSQNPSSLKRQIAPNVRSAATKFLEQLLSISKLTMLLKNLLSAAHAERREYCHHLPVA